MRLSEKTLELNFCKGFPRVLGLDVFWLGLTQGEERHLGFDVCTKAGGVLLAIQMKRFKKTLKRTGARRFDAPHHQMQALRSLDLFLQKARVPRLVAYAIPDASESSHLCHVDCPSLCVNYLDLAQFPSRIPSSGRKSGVHYVDVIGSVAKVHSEEFEVPVVRGEALRDTLVTSGRLQGAEEISPFSMGPLQELINGIGRRAAFGLAV